MTLHAEIMKFVGMIARLDMTGDSDGYEHDGGDAIATLDDLIREARAIVGAPAKKAAPAEDACRKAAEAAGWRHSGDGDGFIYDSNVFDSWKEAVSWSGDDGRDEREQSSNLYETWRECCEAEGIEVG